MNINDKNNEVLDEINKEYEKAAAEYKETELLINLTILECLKSRHDVVANLNSNNPICIYLESWMKQNSFGNSAMSFKVDNDGNGQLSCKFDLYKIRDLFSSVADDMYGTLDPSYAETLMDGDGIEISEERVEELAKTIHRKEEL